MKIADLECLANDLRTLADRLMSKVEAAKSYADPFAAHYFVARKAYRVACDSAGKSGHRIERALLSSYQVAMKLGFQGSVREWETLLKVCRP
jgi:hypothetical protein